MSIIVDNFRKEVIKRRIIRVKYINKNVYLSEGKYSSGYMLSMWGCNCLIDIKVVTKYILNGEDICNHKEAGSIVQLYLKSKSNMYTIVLKWFTI